MGLLNVRSERVKGASQTGVRAFIYGHQKGTSLLQNGTVHIEDERITQFLNKGM